MAAAALWMDLPGDSGASLAYANFAEAGCHAGDQAAAAAACQALHKNWDNSQEILIFVKIIKHPQGQQ